MAEPDERVTIVGGDRRTRAVSLDAYLDARAIETSERDANAWIKSLRHALVDGVPLRDRLTYRGDSLWWFVELYLHKQRTVVSACRAIRALDTLIARERPGHISATGPPLLRLLVSQAAGRHRIQSAGRSQRCAREEEGYVGPVLRALEERLPRGGLALVGLGPRTNFRMRGWRHRLAEFNDPGARALPLAPIEAFAGWRAIQPSMDVWRDRGRVLRALLGSDDVRRAAIVDGYDIWPAIRADLLGVSHLQLPWSARSMDEAAAALDTLRPRVVLTYAEAGGWGRALALEARRRGIPVVGLQHGFIYRHWLNYRHEPDEMAPSPANRADAGFPRPDLTLVYDGFARLHLMEAGHFPPSAIAVTGSPRLEAFAEAGRRLTAADREHVRAAAGAKPGQKLVVLATKFSQIGEWLGPLVDAIAPISDAHLVVKCHPAETVEPYEAVTAAAANVRVMAAGTDLGSLVACADLIVTVNSTAAIEAMALDVPGLVLALPNNLSPFVDSGALAGVERPAEIATAMRRLLYDQAARRSLAEHRRAFIERYGMVSEGGAAARAADAILRLAQGSEASRKP
jgi:hypothetical protein